MLRIEPSSVKVYTLSTCTISQSQTDFFKAFLYNFTGREPGRPFLAVFCGYSLISAQKLPLSVLLCRDLKQGHSTHSHLRVIYVMSSSIPPVPTMNFKCVSYKAHICS